MDANTRASPQPNGYTGVSPYLLVKSVEVQLAFLREAFGATVLEQLRSPSGVIWHADVRIHDTVVMVGRAQRAYPVTKNSLYVWCLDVDAVYKDALNNGATSLEEPMDQFYGVREAGITDPQGNTWWLGQEIQKLSHNEKERFIGDIPPDE